MPGTNPYSPYWKTACFLLVVLTLCRQAPAADAAIDPEDLRPGLLTTYRGPKKSKGIEIVLLEPTIALALKKDEAAHPRLSPLGGTVRWQGYLNILRAGSYRFSAQLRGAFRLTVAGKSMLAADVKTGAPVLKQGPALRLEAGVHTLQAEFTRLPGSARLELFWQAPHFHIEPLPYDAVGHLSDRLPAGYRTSMSVERGRYLAEEHNCTACHRRDEQDSLARGLTPRQGPDLSLAGQRLFPGWIYAWLEAPQKIRPGNPMPDLFPANAAGQVERYAVARYLSSLGGPLQSKDKQPNLKDLVQSINRGRRLFTSVGCMACHPLEKGPRQEGRRGLGLTGARTTFPLAGLGSKTTVAKLAAYLQNPLAVDPSGRMPHMLLQGREAQDLARFLCSQLDPSIKRSLPVAPGKEPMLAAFKRVDPRPEELRDFAHLPADARWLDLGKRLVMDRGCNNCHTIAPGGKGFANVLASASFDNIKSPKVQDRGCLAEKAAQDGKTPWLALSRSDRDALRRFLQESMGAGSPAPAYAGRVALERFNCLACHSRNGEGGLSAKLIEQLRRFEKADNAEAVLPPPLTGAGHKLRTPWIKHVMTHAGRARPWMGLRMPQFGEANIGHLPNALAALEGIDAEDKVHSVPITSARIVAGRRLVGKQAFGCITCHDIAGIPNTGTRGPDLALMNQRVRYPWYRRWLEQAQQMQPGTRMPTVFPDGKSTVDAILDGKPDAQAEAMWAYLSLGPTLHLPEGMEPPKGLVLVVKDRARVLRTFLPDAGSRAIAVGYPGGVATAFDARTCRLAFAWSGNFLDASPVWNDRGGNPAKVLGARFWTAPVGCPWAVNDSNEPPDFSQQARDPAYGADPGDGKVFLGKRHLQFKGYVTDKQGQPTFRYQIEAGDGSTVGIQERPAALRSAAGVGVGRHFDLTLPKHRKTWLYAGTGNQEPRLLDAKGSSVGLDLKTGKTEVAAIGRMLVLPQGEAKVIVLHLTAAPQGTHWHIQRHGGNWQALLGMPAMQQAAKVEVNLKVWSPYRDEPGLLKELGAEK